MLVACRLAGLSALEAYYAGQCRHPDSRRSRWLHTAVSALDGRMDRLDAKAAPRPSWRPARRINVEIPLAFPVGACPGASKSRSITAQFAGKRLRSRARLALRPFRRWRLRRLRLTFLGKFFRQPLDQPLFGGHCRTNERPPRVRERP